MKLTLLAASAGFIPRSDAGAMLRQEWRSHTTRSQGMLKDSPQKYPELFYHEQTVDHFNADDKRIYSQRYFANFDHFKPGGPIFINIGGEGPIDDADVNGKLSNGVFAERVGGAAISVEHRFYGKSQPFDSLATEHLNLLTSRQALHDLAQFQKWLKASNSSLAQSRFFCMGGSYPGNLAAWYRQEFPDMTDGCWSASGPVQAQEDWPGFGEKVWTAVASDINGELDESFSVKLYAGYEQLAGLIQDPTPKAMQTLVEFFNVCPGTLVSQADRDNMEMTITTYPGMIMQYNNTMSPRLSDIRDIVVKSKTALQAALDVSKFLNLTVGNGPNKCTDNSIGSMYKSLLNDTLPSDGSGNAMRTWTWQTCNEFGYFQTATGEFGKPSLYTRAASSRVLWQKVCSDVFGIDEASIGARIAATNKYYGGKQPRDISKVLYSNGDLDAWSLLSVTSYPKNDAEVYHEVAHMGSHCVGLYAPMKGEVPGAGLIREKAFQLFKKWGSLEKNEVIV